MISISRTTRQSNVYVFTCNAHKTLSSFIPIIKNNYWLIFPPHKHTFYYTILWKLSHTMDTVECLGSVYQSTYLQPTLFSVKSAK